uniref:Glycosyl transferase family 2 n=1 Tax=Candidatus Kentrum sp. FW TaxID=2126338 RepID=A0A450SZU5_9GAMM|nr:MAG: Protein of unknown function (DUF1647) [Candidatus Kentron sp. FW]VFJ64882.1 MAG: Protein of unknown function (DUF1647) [Candidatus Kentron sp. FW]
MATQKATEIPVSIVTACNSRFFRTLLQFLKSIARHKQHRKYKIIVYDLGMTVEQLSTLKKKFMRPYGISIKPFSFEKYPEFIREINNPNAEPRLREGAYAWKAPIIEHEIKLNQGIVFWLDSATVILKDLDDLIEKIVAHGQYVPYAGTGRIAEGCHVGTRKKLRFLEGLYSRRRRAGGCCGFSYHHPLAMRCLEKWRALSLQEEIIAPVGANRGNHRYDQMLLGLILYDAEKRSGLVLTEDEVDISSMKRPIYMRTRNKVPNSVPLFLDGLCRMYFWTYNVADRFVIGLGRN